METSEYAASTGLILDGWLEKKSRRTGFWVKRYYVLNESERDFCVLRTYNKCLETSWGVVPIQLKSEIALPNISSVTTNSNKSAKGTEFSIIIEAPKKAGFVDSKDSAITTNDAAPGTVSHILQLRAPDAQVIAALYISYLLMYAFYSYS